MFVIKSSYLTHDILLFFFARGGTMRWSLKAKCKDLIPFILWSGFFWQRFCCIFWGFKHTLLKLLNRFVLLFKEGNLGKHTHTHTQLHKCLWSSLITYTSLTRWILLLYGTYDCSDFVFLIFCMLLNDSTSISYGIERSKDLLIYV